MGSLDSRKLCVLYPQPPEENLRFLWGCAPLCCKNLCCSSRFGTGGQRAGGRRSKNLGIAISYDVALCFSRSSPIRNPIVPTLVGRFARIDSRFEITVFFANRPSRKWIAAGLDANHANLNANRRDARIRPSASKMGIFFANLRNVGVRIACGLPTKVPTFVTYNAFATVIACKANRGGSIADQAVL